METGDREGERRASRSRAACEVAMGGSSKMNEAAHAPPLIVTTSTSGYAHWLRHLHRNLAFLGLDKQLRVCSADASTAELAASLGVQSVTPWHAPLNTTSRSVVRAVDYGLDTPAMGQSPGTFMSSSWRAAAHFKQHCVWGLLERSAPGAHLLLVDGDITFFQDPLPLLLPRSEHNHTAAMVDDITLMDDSTPSSLEPYLNSGFMLLRNSAATRSFGRAFLEQLQHHRYANDQGVLNDVLRSMSATGPFARGGSGAGRRMGSHASSSSTGVSSSSKGVNVKLATKPGAKHGTKPGAKLPGMASSKARGGVLGGLFSALHNTTLLGGLHGKERSTRRGGGLRVRVLDVQRFSNGYFFYEYRDKRPLNASAMVVVHHNWIRGDSNKWARALAYDTLVTDPTETYRRFLRRARSSMVRMHAWKYRDPSHPGNAPVE